MTIYEIYDVFKSDHQEYMRDRLQDTLTVLQSLAFQISFPCRPIWSSSHAPIWVSPAHHSSLHIICDERVGSRGRRCSTSATPPPGGRAPGVCLELFSSIIDFNNILIEPEDYTSHPPVHVYFYYIKLHSLFKFILILIFSLKFV